MSYKITQAEIDANNVKSVVGNTLTGTVTQNKNVFDKLIEFLCGKFNTFVDYVEANMLTSSIVGNLIDLDTTYKENTVGAINEVLGDVGDVSTLNTAYKTNTVGAINEVNGKLNKYLVATAGSNGDFSLTISGTLSTNNVVCIKFPSATNNTKNARISIDGGTTYINVHTSINVPASAIENRNISFVYNGTYWVPLDVISSVNSNGRWTQYPDGTQICYISDYTFINDVTEPSGNVYRTPYEEVTLPLAFVDASYVSHIGIVSFARWGNIYEASSSAVRVSQFAGLSTTSVGARITAIGRWK